MPTRLILIALLLNLADAGPALAQDKGSVDPKPLPPLSDPHDPKLAAKELFARKMLPSATPTRVIGSYMGRDAPRRAEAHRAPRCIWPA